ncbi:MAG: hypothetical protein ABUR63_02260 [Verrucomicrobiota bacterium]
MTASRCALVLAAATLVACGSSGSTTGTTNGNVAMTDQNNYTSMSTLNLPVVQTKAASDLSISWTGVMKDLLCHAASSIDNVAFLKVPNMTKDQIQTALAEGTLVASQVKSYYEWHTGGATSTMLSSLKFGGAIDLMNDYTESATTQYLMLFTHGTLQGVGAQAMVLLQPTAASSNTTVAAPDACGSNVLTSFVATFGTPLGVPKAGPYTVDWSKLTKDSFGHAIQFQNIDQIEVAYFQGKQTSDLMAHFLDVEIDATSLYAAKLSTAGQKSFDLTGATTTSGTAFSGFSQTDGTWALALRCSSCSVPAPVAFTILQPL